MVSSRPARRLFPTMPAPDTILQIVPQLPGTFDGVGDYALNLAQALSVDHGITTTFLVAEKTNVNSRDGFNVLSGLTRETPTELAEKCEHVILHYVNYGYQRRGVPFRFLEFLMKLRPQCSGLFLTVFHELYASGPPWQSAFWLQPWQKRIARKISLLSDRRIVSNALVVEQLRHLDPSSTVSLHPVPSNFGEPVLTWEEINRRDPHRWAICGGGALIQRSLDSLLSIRRFIPESSRPHELFVLGGKENDAVRSLIQSVPDLEIIYRPEISVAHASEILSTCSFGWIDYFRQRAVPTVAILKSTSFSAFCAHGVVPVFPRPGSPIFISDDYLPDPFFVAKEEVNLPSGEDVAEISREVYDWYRRNAAVRVLAARIVELVRSTDSTAKGGDIEREGL